MSKIIKTSSHNKKGSFKKVDFIKRIMIEKVFPEIDEGLFPIKRTVGEKVVVRAHIFADGHDIISADLLYRNEKQKDWEKVRMSTLGNDVWSASFTIEKMQIYYYTVQAWIDEFQTWQSGLRKKSEAGQDISVDLQVGIGIIEEKAMRSSGTLAKELEDWISRIQDEKDPNRRLALALDQKIADLFYKNPDENGITRYKRELRVDVDQPKALFGSWYEIFPRSCGSLPGKHANFKDCEGLLPELSRMGFDILYLTPIHPIGITNRKGRNNSLACAPNDPGSPWAIGSKEGGHKAINPLLGNLEDFRSLLKKAKTQGIDIALDLAFQCSPDHPYVKEHPEWFKWRPDGLVQFAENPPKKYEDIIPFNFDTVSWKALWEELKSIVFFWAEQGVRIFRVDNPHTKPFAFWEWLIKETKQKYPDIIFLSEAFTRPKIMYRLAKIGFQQSYTYFTWRNTKQEFTEYLLELTQGDVAEFFRPNFWPNTPDILSEYLQYGGRPAFMARLVMAATMSSNYGIYGPAFELCINEALPGKEEYNNSEKYEIKHWEKNRPQDITDFISRVNKIRKENPALQRTKNLKLCEINNQNLIAYLKTGDDLSNIIVTVVNLDPFHTQSGWLHLPIQELGIEQNRPYLAHDLLSNDKYIWQGGVNYIELNPQIVPAHILRLHRRLHREQDFDYYL